jgi:protein-S-isoprenylcysteine O-methyltransferase Ste14
LKEHVAPDRGWQVFITIPVSILISIFPLGVYWLAPYFIASTSGRFEASPMRRILATLLFGIGVAIMFGTDVQKYFVLKARTTRGLITDGFFEMCRHPNYFGEMMLYGAFALLVVEPNRARIAWTILIAIWSIVFTTQMLQKEARMSRHQGWQEYKNSTAFVVPYLF